MSVVKIHAPTFGDHFTGSYATNEEAFKALASAVDKAVLEYTGLTNDHGGWPWDRESLCRLDLLRRGMKPTFSLKRAHRAAELCGWVGSPNELPGSRIHINPRQLLLFSVVAEKQLLLELTEEILMPGIRSATFHRLEDAHCVVWL